MNKATQAPKIKVPKTDIEPLHDNLLVVAQAVTARTAAGLYVPQPEKHERSATIGLVIAAGPESRCVSAGDKVVFNGTDCPSVDEDGATVIIVEERKVHATLRS